MSDSQNSAPVSTAPQSNEPAVPETTVQPRAEDGKFASKFAALTRKEKEIKEREKSFAQKMQEIQEKESKYSSWEQERSQLLTDKDSWKTKLKQNPFEALKEAGLTFEELVEMQLNDQNPTADMKLSRMQKELEDKTNARMAELEAKLAAKEEAELKAREEHEKAQYDQVVTAFKSQIAEFAETNKDTYELVYANDAQDLVFQVIEEHHKSTSRILDVETAMKAVEEHLEEEAKKILELKKFKQPSKPESQETKQTAPTLSNALSQEAPQRTEKPMSTAERNKLAASMIRFTSGN